MNSYVTWQRLRRPILHGPYMGMEETITNTDCNMPFLCYFCGREPDRGAYWSIIGDHKGNAYCCRCLCASCAREHINGIPDRAGKSPYQSLDPRKELRLLQARKNRARARRNQAVAHLLFWLVIAFACVAVAAFIVCASYTITNIVLG